MQGLVHLVGIGRERHGERKRENTSKYFFSRDLVLTFDSHVHVRCESLSSTTAIIIRQSREKVASFFATFQS